MRIILLTIIICLAFTGKASALGCDFFNFFKATTGCTFQDISEKYHNNLPEIDKYHKVLMDKRIKDIKDKEDDKEDQTNLIDDLREELTTPDQYNYLPIDYAIEQGDDDLIEAMLPYVFYNLKYKQIILINLILHKNYRIIDQAIQEGADVNTYIGSKHYAREDLISKEFGSDFKQLTPLFAACYTNDPRIIDLILDREKGTASIETTISDSKTRISAAPFSYLIKSIVDSGKQPEKGLLDNIDKFLDEGQVEASNKKNINVDNELSVGGIKYTALTYLLYKLYYKLSSNKQANDYGLIDKLITHKAETDKTLIDGITYTPLYLAAQIGEATGNSNIFDKIFEKCKGEGDCINAKVGPISGKSGQLAKTSVLNTLFFDYDETKQTSGRESFIKTAIKQLLDLEYEKLDNLNNNPLQITGTDNQMSGEFTQLLMAIIKLNSENDQEKREREEIINLLIKHHADPNYLQKNNQFPGIKGQHKYSPFHYVAKKNYEDLYNTFVQNGGDLRKQDAPAKCDFKTECGKSALDYKAENCENDMAAYLGFRLDDGHKLPQDNEFREIICKDKSNRILKTPNSASVKNSDSKCRNSIKENLVHILIKKHEDNNKVFEINGAFDKVIQLLDGYTEDSCTDNGEIKISWQERTTEGKNVLDYALKFDRRDVVNHILEKNIPATPQNDIGSSESIFSLIDYAFKYGCDKSDAKDWLNKWLDRMPNSADISKRIGDKQTPVDPFVYAAIVGTPDVQQKPDASDRKCVLKILFDKQNKFQHRGLDEPINKKDGTRPIHMADNDDIIEMLINYGAGLYKEDSKGQNAIDYAFSNKRSYIIKKLINENRQLGKSIFTAIEVELNEDFNSHNYIEDFIKKDRNLTKKTKQYKNGQFTPLLYTAAFEIQDKGKFDNSLSIYRKNIIDALSDADINEQVRGGEMSGSTALILAVERGDLILTEHLLKKGADITIKNTQNKTALMYAIENLDKGQTTNEETTARSIFNALTKKLGANFGKNEGEATIIRLLAHHAPPDIILNYLPILLKNDPNCLERKDKSGWTAFLYAAAYNKDYKAMEYLRMYGANVHATITEGGKTLNAIQLAETKRDKNNQKEFEDITERLESYGVYAK